MRTKKRYIAKMLPDDASNEEIASELRRLVNQPKCPPAMRELVLGVVHEHEMEQLDIRARAARKAAAKVLDEI